MLVTSQRRQWFKRLQICADVSTVIVPKCLWLLISSGRDNRQRTTKMMVDIIVSLSPRTTKMLPMARWRLLSRILRAANDPEAQWTASSHNTQSTRYTVNKLNSSQLISVWPSHRATFVHPASVCPSLVHFWLIIRGTGRKSECGEKTSWSVLSENDNKESVSTYHRVARYSSHTVVKASTEKDEFQPHGASKP